MKQFLTLALVLRNIRELSIWLPFPLKSCLFWFFGFFLIQTSEKNWSSQDVIPLLQLKQKRRRNRNMKAKRLIEVFFFPNDFGSFSQSLLGVMETMTYCIQQHSKSEIAPYIWQRKKPTTTLHVLTKILKKNLPHGRNKSYLLPNLVF